MSKKLGAKKGFTLAEVLITLGIIGVVAAMTIPTLIANTNSSKFASQFKKSLSTLNQAALMATAQNDMDYGSITKSDTCNASASLSNGNASICGLFNSTLAGATFNDGTALGNLTSNGKKYAPYLAAVATPAAGAKARGTTATALTNYVGYQMADGSLVVVNKDIENCTVDGLWSGGVGAATTSSSGATSPIPAVCFGWIDVNGATLPNKEVTCSDDKATISTEVCTVPKDTSHMTDIYPIVFHDQTVEPATNAAKAVLTGATAKGS